MKEASEKELEEVLEVSRANTQAIRDALEAEAASEKQALIKGENLCFKLRTSAFGSEIFHRSYFKK